MSAICNNCPGYAGCALNPDGMPCKRRRKELGYYPSNADRIRAMSDEELASFLLFFVPTKFSKAMYTGVSGEYDTSAEDAIRHSLDWLTQPAQED